MLKDTKNKDEIKDRQTDVSKLSKEEKDKLAREKIQELKDLKNKHGKDSEIYEDRKSGILALLSKFLGL